MTPVSTQPSAAASVATSAILAAAATALLWPGSSFRARRRLRAVRPGAVPRLPPSTRRGARFPRAPLAGVAAAVGTWALAYGVVGFAGAAVLATLGGWVAASIVSQLPTARDGIASARLLADLPAALDLLAACLRAGAAPAQALRAVAGAFDPPLGPVLFDMVRRIDPGSSPDTAPRPSPADIARRPGRPPPTETPVTYTPAAGGSPRGRAGPDMPFGRSAIPAELLALQGILARAARTGAPVADILDRLAAAQRAARTANARAAAAKLGVRAVLPLGMFFLPAFVLTGIVPVVVGLVRGAFG